MTLENITAIAWKEFREHKIRILVIFLSIPVLSAIFLLPNLFVRTSLLADFIDQYGSIYASYPSGLRRILILVDLQLPIYILIPAFASPYFGILESIIGERDARTLEGLFILPVNKWEILYGKIGVSTIGAILTSWFAFLYHLVVFFIFFGHIPAWHIISVQWLIILFYLVPAVVYFTSMTAILIAMRVKKIQTAVNLATLVFAPFFFVLIGIGTGYYKMGIGLILEVGAFLIVLGVLLTILVKHVFSIEKLLLNLHE